MSACPYQLLLLAIDFKLDLEYVKIYRFHQKILN